MTDLPDHILSALDAWRLEQSPPIERDEAIRIVLEDWLIGHGYLPAPEEDRPT